MRSRVSPGSPRSESSPKYRQGIPPAIDESVLAVHEDQFMSTRTCDSGGSPDQYNDGAASFGGGVTLPPRSEAYADP